MFKKYIKYGIILKKNKFKEIIMGKVTWKAGTFIYPIPAVMVSTGDMINSNIITVGWTGIICTNPAKVYISVRPERYSYDLLKQTGEFVINLTNEELTYATDWCGVKSGRNVDKFAEMKLTKEKANFVKCPMIKESPVSVECRITEIKELGSHHMFIADVLAINADDKYIDEKGSFDISKCNLIAYANGGYFGLSDKIGKFGYSVAKNPDFNSNNKVSKDKNEKHLEKNKKEINRNETELQSKNRKNEGFRDKKYKEKMQRKDNRQNSNKKSNDGKKTNTTLKNKKKKY